MVVLSVLMNDGTAAQLTELSQYLPASIELWGGGTALGTAECPALPARLRLFGSLAEFDQAILLMTSRQPH